MKSKAVFLRCTENNVSFLLALLMGLFGGGGEVFAIEKIKPATEVMQCRASDVVEWMRAGKSGPPVAPSRNVSCYLRHSDIKNWEREEGIVVDVRPAADFERYHPAGALNLTATDIKTKAYLSGRPILIIGAGRGEQYLEEVCADLFAKGFKRVKILDGGITAWIRSRADSVGLANELQLASELNAVDLYVEQRTKEAFFVIVQGSSFDESQFKPNAVIIKSDASPATVVSAINSASSRTKGTMRRTIILGANHFGPMVMGALIQEKGVGMPIFYFRGSRQDYDREIKRELAMWSKAEQGPAPHRCGNR